MTIDFSKFNTRYPLDTAYAQGPRSLLISVRQAALRLGVSKSTVYRIDREHGPFRFETMAVGSS